MFQLFNDIITGDLQLHLIPYNDLSKLKTLLNNDEINYFEECKIIISNSDYFKRGCEKYVRFDIEIDKKNLSNSKVTHSSKRQRKALKNFDIFDPPSDKADLYLTLIEKEVAFFLREVNSFLNDSNDIKEIELFALNNIRILKEFARHLRINFEELGGENDDFFNSDPDYFILYRLKFYIINLIQYLQKTFSPFCNLKLESSSRLKHDLFNETDHHWNFLSIMLYLMEDKDFDQFINKYGRKSLKKIFKQKNYNEGELGKGLFDAYILKFKELSQEDQLINYNKALHFWNELIISNNLKILDIDEYKNNPDIEIVLIPLLKSKIEFLENEIKIQSLVKVVESTNLGLKGFKCDLDNKQKNLLFKYLKDQIIIDTSEAHFNSLLCEEQLPKDFTKIKWILLWRNKPHQQALRDLFEVLLGKDNVPSDKKINDYFADKKGNLIKFSKPHGNSNYLNDFKKVVNPK